MIPLLLIGVEAVVMVEEAVMVVDLIRGATVHPGGVDMGRLMMVGIEVGAAAAVTIGMKFPKKNYYYYIKEQGQFDTNILNLFGMLPYTIWILRFI